MCFWCYILGKYPEGFNGKPWNFKVLSRNKSICFSCIINNMNEKWDFDRIGMCVNLPWDHIVCYRGTTFKFDFNGFVFFVARTSFVMNPHIPLAIIERYSEVYMNFDWPSRYISENKELTTEYIERNPHGIGKIPWSKLIMSDKVPIDFVAKHPKGFCGKPWNLDELSKNPSLTWDFYIKHKNKLYSNGDWRSTYLSQNENFVKSIPDLQSFFTISWNTHHLSGNPSLPLDLVVENPDGINGEPWSLNQLCHNKFLPSDSDGSGATGIGQNIFIFQDTPLNLSFDYIDKHPEGFRGKSWNMRSLSSHKNLPLYLVEKYPNGIGGEPWIISLFFGDDMTFDFLEKYQDGFCGQLWDMKQICKQTWIKDTNRIRFQRVKAIIQ